MFKKIFLAIIAVLAIFTFVGCNNQNRIASLDPLSGSGTYFYLKFTTNPSTGYNWEYKQQEDEKSAKLLLIDVKEEEGNSAPGVVGAEQKITYTFKAENAGKNVLVFTYKRPWVGGEEAYSVEYDLEVDDEKNIKCTDRRIEEKDSEVEISEIPYPFFYTENN